MSLNTPPIVNAKSSKKKYVWGAIIVSCIFIIAGVIVFNQYKNFNLNVTEAEKSFNMDKFAEAKQSYQTALKFKADNDVKAKIELCDDVEVSYKEFYNGTDLFNKKNYLGAYTAFKKVIPQDEKRFALAKEKIPEISKLYIDDEIAQAQNSASTKDYRIAMSHIDLVLRFDPKNETAKTLKTQYQPKYSEQLDAENKAYAQTKAQEQTQPKALVKKQGVRIGMTQQEVLDSNWGKPKDINKTTNAYGTHEQWVYSMSNYLYFDNGILTSIQN